MSNNGKESYYLVAARELLSSVKGQDLTSHEREKKAIELASYILMESSKEETAQEKKQHQQLARMMRDPVGKVFTTAMTDECFRSKDPYRVADQMIHLIDLFGIPRYLGWFKRMQLKAFKAYGRRFARIIVPLAVRSLRKETSKVIIPGEKGPFKRHVLKRRSEGVRLNVNHLGEAILGEEEAKRRLKVYLDDLTEDTIDYVSIKVSTVFSQINLVAYEETIEHVATRLRELYRQAIKYPITREDGSVAPKFVNLDMEEYRDLFLTKDVFMKVLSEKEFFNLEAGIVIQAYLPDSFLYVEELTKWAKERVDAGGAPIKIRVVKGANMAMEMVESALHGWSQAPHKSKMDSDATYKKILNYVLLPENARAVHIGVASHNLFDIAYALILRVENGVEKEVNFEMLEGMAGHMQRVVQKLSGGILLYCAVATKADFQNAIAYLIRRLDENTGPDNFLRHSFGLKPGSPQWELQTTFFQEACSHIESISTKPRRCQDRSQPPKKWDLSEPFDTDPETDFALPQNREWGHEILKRWESKSVEPIPLVIGGKEVIDGRELGQGFDPSRPGKVYYSFALATPDDAEEAIKAAKNYESTVKEMGARKRAEILSNCAQQLRIDRAEILGAMVADGGKTLVEADVEYCEAIDFIEYYARQMLKIDEVPDIDHTPKGTALITPPWNFPVSIPVGGVVAAFVTGNSVILKPAPEAVLSAYAFCQALWKGGIPKEALQFFNCSDDPVGSSLIQDERINLVVLTGATSTAKRFLKMRPKIDLSAETGGKNALIVSAMSDRDQAVKDIIRSAFGHNGQKCSACSLAILEKEVYDDPNFIRQLKDGVESLKVGSAWDKESAVTPLIREPDETLKRGLSQLEPGESWLVTPLQDPNNPNLWSPGVKLGVRQGSFSHRTELFGPVLGLMRANDLDEAIAIANDTPYGLTSGISSLDDREQRKWQSLIVAGNCYINRGITGAIVQRQPFGGTKSSAFGPGKKAGGPNYLHHFLHLKQTTIPKETFPVNEWIQNLTGFLEKFDLSAEALGMWTASIGSYAFWWEYFRRPQDLTKLVGQDNYLMYTPIKKLCVRIGKTDTPTDFLRIFAAAMTAKVPLEVSWEKVDDTFPPKANWAVLLPHFNFVEESEEEMVKRIRTHEIRRLRTIGAPSDAVYKAAAEAGCYIDCEPPLANGRFEMPRYLREIALSVDYHRYGNLGTRENEARRPLP